MLDPEIADRVHQLEAAGKRRGDAIGIAQWERDHANDPQPGWANNDNPEGEPR
jgi:hypothetical protein